MARSTFLHLEHYSVENKGHEEISLINHLSTLNSIFLTPPFKLSGVICTIGPSSSSVETLENMIMAGMTIARLNLSFGSLETYKEMIQNIRQASVNVNKRLMSPSPIAIAVDTSGPEIRMGGFAQGQESKLKLEVGKSVILTTDSSFEDSGTAEKLYVDYSELGTVLEKNQYIQLDQGKVVVSVESISDNDIKCNIVVGGVLNPRTCIYASNIYKKRNVITPKDIASLEFALKENVDCIFVTLTMSADTIVQVKRLITNAVKETLVFAKIQDKNGLKNIKEIIDVSDGIVISRQENSIYIPFEEVFIHQKALFAQCNLAGKPCICASEILLSMINKPRATRAETCDVANAIFDVADCIMLSDETAVGDYPVECVNVMSNICKEAEWAIRYRNLFNSLISSIRPPLDPTHTIAVATVDAAKNCLASAIIVMSISGRSAILMSKYRPQCPVIVVTCKLVTARILKFYRSLKPLHYDKERDDNWLVDIENRFKFAVDYGKHKGFIGINDFVVLVTGWKIGSGFTNTMRIELISE